MGATPGYFRLHLSNEKRGLRFKVKSSLFLFAAILPRAVMEFGAKPVLFFTDFGWHRYIGQSMFSASKAIC
jgi:hypothetical protein